MLLKFLSLSFWKSGFSFSSRNWEVGIQIFSLFADFQDFQTKDLLLFLICEILKPIPFLFSISKIVKTDVSFYSRFIRLCSLFLFLLLWEMLHILERNMHFRGLRCGGKLLYVMRFSGDIWCQKRKISFSPLENYELSISLSLLKIGEQDLTFLFLFSKTEILFSLSLSLLEAWA